MNSHGLQHDGKTIKRDDDDSNQADDQSGARGPSSRPRRCIDLGEAPLVLASDLRNFRENSRREISRHRRSISVPLREPAADNRPSIVMQSGAAFLRARGRTSDSPARETRRPPAFALERVSA